MFPTIVWEEATSHGDSGASGGLRSPELIRLSYILPQLSADSCWDSSPAVMEASGSMERVLKWREPRRLMASVGKAVRPLQVDPKFRASWDLERWGGVWKNLPANEVILLPAIIRFATLADFISAAFLTL